MSGGWEPPADATANSSFALDIIDLYCRPAQPEAETTNQQNTDRLEIEKELSEAFETSEVPLRTAITDSITAYISLKPILTLIGDYAVPVYAAVTTIAGGKDFIDPIKLIRIATIEGSIHSPHEVHSLLVTDKHRIRRINLRSGVVTTVVGSTTRAWRPNSQTPTGTGKPVTTKTADGKQSGPAAAGETKSSDAISDWFRPADARDLSIMQSIGFGGDQGWSGGGGLYDWLGDTMAAGEILAEAAAKADSAACLHTPWALCAAPSVGRGGGSSGGIELIVCDDYGLWRIAVVDRDGNDIPTPKPQPIRWTLLPGMATARDPLRISSMCVTHNGQTLYFANQRFGLYSVDIKSGVVDSLSFGWRTDVRAVAWKDVTEQTTLYVSCGQEISEYNVRTRSTTAIHIAVDRGSILAMDVIRSSGIIIAASSDALIYAFDPNVPSSHAYRQYRVSPIAGCGVRGCVDGRATIQAQLSQVTSLCVSADEQFVYFVDGDHNSIRKLSLPHPVLPKFVAGDALMEASLAVAAELGRLQPLSF